MVHFDMHALLKPFLGFIMFLVIIDYVLFDFLAGRFLVDQAIILSKLEDHWHDKEELV